MLVARLDYTSLLGPKFDSNTLCLSAEKKKTLQWLRHVKNLDFIDPPTDGISTLLLVYFGQQRGQVCISGKLNARMTVA